MPPDATSLTEFDITVHPPHVRAAWHRQHLELDLAITAANEALALDPSDPRAHFTLGECLLLRGEFTLGWPHYEHGQRLTPEFQPSPDWPLWDGSHLPGRLLLIADQGYGDAIQFCRFIPWAATYCSELAVACESTLAPLLRQTCPVGTLLLAHWSDQPPFSAYCYLSSLPHRAKFNPLRAPLRRPYLSASRGITTNRYRYWSDHLSSRIPRTSLRVGLAWAGRSTHVNDRNRSLTLSALAPLFDNRVTFVSLQKGSIEAYEGRAPFLPIGPSLTDFGDTAAVISELDLVITVDTAIAHLAGALGRPCWLLLPYAPDWRWLLDRNDTPWYPSIRLFRQDTPGDWLPVIRTVASLLTQE